MIKNRAVACQRYNNMSRRDQTKTVYEDECGGDENRPRLTV